MSFSAFHASARFGLGARGNEIKIIGNDPKGWLKDQLQSPKIPPEVAQRYSESLKDMVDTSDTGNKNKAKFMMARDVYINETSNRLLAQIRSDQPFIERLVLFWSNHFTVSIQKGLVRGIVNRYEVDAIRPHISGYFKDMLLAVCQHPAMLFYLDNIRSFGANSVVGKQRKKGLNENLAREILELHTLGVNGGYTQNDVISLAKIITGWTLDGNIRDGTNVKFKFQKYVHEPGNKVLLEKRFKENGEQEGIDALTMLATHPATAKHIATKLARHFILDNPPKSAVDQLTKSFLKSGGHLPTVMETLINLKESWKYPYSKVKNPYEFVVSALRLTGMEPDTNQAMKSLKSLNYIAFNAPSPAGFDDEASTWTSPDSIMKRIEWGHKMAQKLPPRTNPLDLVQIGLGGVLSTSTRKVIEGAASGTDGVGLLFASPEFQRR